MARSFELSKPCKTMQPDRSWSPGFSCPKGKRSPDARVQFVLTGGTRTMLVNLMRLSAVAATLAMRRPSPAALFHDYGGAILVGGWWFAFWTFAHCWIPGPAPSEGLEVAVA